MDLSQLSPEQFKELVRGIVDDRLRELLGDPDLGLQLGDSLRARLKESLSSTERLSGEDIADQLGLRWYGRHGLVSSCLSPCHPPGSCEP